MSVCFNTLANFHKYLLLLDP